MCNSSIKFILYNFSSSERHLVVISPFGFPDAPQCRPWSSALSGEEEKARKAGKHWKNWKMLENIHIDDGICQE